MKFLDDLKIEIVSSGRELVENQWNHKRPHFDPFNRFYFIIKGNAKIKYDNAFLNLKENYAYLLPANRQIQLRKPEGVFDHIYFDFRIQILGGIELFNVIETPLEFPEQILKKHLPANWKSYLTKNKNINSSIVLLKKKAILQLLLNPFIEKGVEKNKQSERQLERFENVISYINSHFSENLKIEDLAAKAFLQTTYFSNLFSKQFGIGPQKYLSRIRINNAQSMLENTDFPVKEIAEKVGYDDELYFSRLFKKYVGLPPTLYRKRRKEIRG